MENTGIYFAELFLRCFLGILFIFQGYDKLFRIGISGVVKTFHSEAESHHVPDLPVWMISIYSSVCEFFAGILLVLGLFKIWSLMLLGVDLILVAFAFSYMKPMWDMRHVYPRFVLLTASMLIPAAWEKFSLDHLIFK